MKTFLMLCVVMAMPAWAAECTRVEGTVSFNGKPVSPGFLVQETGEFTTGPSSRATILISGNEKDGKSEVHLEPETRLRIEPGETARAHLLLQGTVRSRLRDKVHKNKFQLKTASAVMGVRGTDFLATFGPKLKESEIVVFEGTVSLTNAARPGDTKKVNKGYWGGVGGRYGTHIGELIKLPADVFKHYDESTQF